MNFKIIFLIIFFLFCVSGNAQNKYSLGFLPSMTIEKQFSSNWNLNTKIESRQVFKDYSGFDYEYLLTDFTFIVDKKIGSNNNLGSGNVLRVNGNILMHRFIQQFSLNKEYKKIQINHRFRFDQSFERNVKPEYRFRYRIAMELPLNLKEFYFKGSYEYLNSLQNNEYNLEFRLVPMLGYEFTNQNKLEIGIDYRSDFLPDDGSRNILWISTNYYFLF